MNKAEQVDILEKSIRRLELIASNGSSGILERLQAELQLTDALQVLRGLSNAS